MDIKSVGAYSAAFLAGASGVATIAGLSLALICGIKALVYKILFTINPASKSKYKPEMKDAKELAQAGLIISIPIVGALIIMNLILNDEDKNKPNNAETEEVIESVV